MAPIIEVLNGIHTAGKDPFEEYVGHSKLATIDVCSYQDPTSMGSVHTSEPLADDQTLLSEWLHCYPAASRDGRVLSGGLKLLIVHVRNERNTPSSSLQARSMLRMAFDELQLPTAALYYLWAPSSDFMSFPVTRPPNGTCRQAHCLIMGHWSMSWSFDSAENFSRGIVLIPDNDKGKPTPPFNQTINALKDFVDQPCFLGLAASIIALSRVSESILKTYNDARDMKYEFRAYGQHEAGSVSRLADPSKASMDVMYHASRALGYHDRLRMLRLLNTFLSRQLSDFTANMTNESEARRQRAATLDEALIHLDHKVTSLISVTQKVHERATMQLAVLFNIIAQKDSKVSIEIAAASRALAMENKKDQRISIAIAKASREIAVESKRDSSSMKTIAAVTMLFLPGTFIASLFATPMFQWSATAGLQVESHIWIYWAVSIPLTLLTIGMWWVWLKFTTARERAQLQDADDFDALADPPSDAEKSYRRGAPLRTEEADKRQDIDDAHELERTLRVSAEPKG